MPSVNKNRPKPWRAGVHHRNDYYFLGFYDTIQEAELAEVEFKIGVLEDRRKELLVQLKLAKPEVEDTICPVCDKRTKNLRGHFYAMRGDTRHTDVVIDKLLPPVRKVGDRYWPGKKKGLHEEL